MCSRMLSLLVTIISVSLMSFTESIEKQTHLNYTEIDSVPANKEIGFITQDAGFEDKYNGSIVMDFQFTVLKGTLKEYFNIATNKGILSTSRTIDRDTVCAGQLECDIILDIGLVKPHPYFQIVKVILTLIDINDNAPRFIQDETVIRISENASPGVNFVLPNAEDPDSPENGIQGYELDDHSGTFGLQVKTTPTYIMHCIDLNFPKSKPSPFIGTTVK